MDKFFSIKFCERCGASLRNGRIMSMMNTQVICMDCKSKEMSDKNYRKAVDRDVEEIRNGNYNYGGLLNEKVSSENI